MLKKFILILAIVLMNVNVNAAPKKEAEPDTYEMLNLFGEVMERAKYRMLKKFRIKN